jgi:hypothetical protein
VSEAPLTPEQVKLILRRAAELEGGHEDGAVSEQDLEAIAGEVGIGATAVRRAISELRSGALVPVAPPSGGLIEKTFGPAEAIVERPLHGVDARAVRNSLARFLASQLFELSRDFGERTIWTGARGMWSGLQRSLNLGGRYAFLPEVEIDVTIIGGEDVDTMVRAIVRMSAERRRRVQLAAVGGAAGGAFIAIGLLAAAGHPAVEVATTAVGVAGGATVVGRSRRGYRRDLFRATLALERWLDQLQRG